MSLRREDGFTLIEFFVVVLIVGILAAIALPTFLGAKERREEKESHTPTYIYLVDGTTVECYNASKDEGDWKCTDEEYELIASYPISRVDHVSRTHGDALIVQSPSPSAY